MTESMLCSTLISFTELLKYSSNWIYNKKPTVNGRQIY